MAVTRACVCGNDLWPYKTVEKSKHSPHFVVEH